MMGKITLITMALVLVGCASRSDVIKDNYRRDFTSTKSPGAVAVCIDQNANNYPLNILRSNITNVEGQPVEVLVRNGDSIYAVAQITPIDGGSKVALYFGGIASIGPDTAANNLMGSCRF